MKAAAKRLAEQKIAFHVTNGCLRISIDDTARLRQVLLEDHKKGVSRQTPQVKVVVQEL